MSRPAKHAIAAFIACVLIGGCDPAPVFANNPLAARSASPSILAMPPVLISVPPGQLPAIIAPLPKPASVSPASPPSPKPVATAALDPVAAALAAELRRSAPVLPDHPAETQTAIGLARAMLQQTHTTLDARQVVLVVDRSSRVQRLWVVVAYPGNQLGEVLGAVSVSTGKPGRKEHFRTPVGVFVNDGSILGYRAQGTYNENHIRGNGVKGMRVWDFGWQTTDDWRTPGALMAVRLEMHATDPANLELRLGRWDSEGCIRIPSRFNSFIDHVELIDAKLHEAAQTARRFAALLPKNAEPTPLAGTTVIVIDSSEPSAPPSDPVRANAMEHPADMAPGHDDAG